MLNKYQTRWAAILVLALVLPFSTAQAQSTSNTQVQMTGKGNKLRPTLPAMNAQRGRKLFAEKGCVVCHSVNGVGAIIGPPLDTANMPLPMDAFGFIARMWRGAPAMALMQEDIFGDIIDLTGQDLVDLVAFAYDEEEQKKLTKDQIPQKIRDILPQ